jgi:hypothetical protein
MCDNLAESSPSADSLQTLELLHEQGDAMAVDFHAKLTHHFHLDLTHPGS